MEACVEGTAEAEAAERGGAARLELCARLDLGGTTPDDALVAEVCGRVRIPVFVMVRPRGGDFVFTDREADIMLADVARVRELGASGIVTGALTTGGQVDAQLLGRLVAAAGPLPVTFHRAFDLIRDDDAVRRLIECGVRRILTSGGGARAIDAVGAIRGTVERSDGRIGIVACGGVSADHAARLVALTGVRELHARVARLAGSAAMSAM
ncbi:MAG TPA: copper homeostasis protein CutC [Gemmatimonadaceae bacterium]|nr:copper homeostasis protein CutC [Gemmatimonadaceae bacterium]